MDRLPFFAVYLKTENLEPTEIAKKNHRASQWRARNQSLKLLCAFLSFFHSLAIISIRIIPLIHISNSTHPINWSFLFAWGQYKRHTHSRMATLTLCSTYNDNPYNLHFFVFIFALNFVQFRSVVCFFLSLSHCRCVLCVQCTHICMHMWWLFSVN